MLGSGQFHSAADLGGLGNITFDKHRLPAAPADVGRCLRAGPGINVNNDHVRGFTGEQFRNGLADAMGGAGDECDFILQSHGRRMSERFDFDQHGRMGLNAQRVAQRPSKALKAHLHDVPVGQFDAIPEAENIRAKKMDMRVSRTAMRGIFEMVVLQVGQRSATCFSPRWRRASSTVSLCHARCVPRRVRR